jgi:hypothetical protein
MGHIQNGNSKATQTSKNQQPSNLRQPTIHSIQTVTCIRNYNTAHMQNFPIHDLTPFDQCYTGLARISRHKGGGSDVRPSRRRGGSSGGQGLQKLHRRPAQAPVGLHGEGSEGATCPPPLYWQDLAASLGEAAAPACCTHSELSST